MLAHRIAMSQTYLKADQTAVQVAATRDRGLRTAKSLDKQDLHHPGLVSGLSDLVVLILRHSSSSSSCSETNRA